ncbi:hypothetical protein [Dactylosporangium sp. CA-233914]|uniref:hypothetical protein n=1 Tax=Dactylosporangium sp. CA-233914 TaxID=3239934 RepID=UPI003D949F4F
MNELDEGDLRVLMHRDDAPPASRVDLDRVVSDGRRVRRRRGLATSAVSAAAILALTGTVALALQSGRPDGMPSQDAGQSVMPQRPSAGGFDPVLLLRLKPGWLPQGVTADPDPSLWAAMQSEHYKNQDGTIDFTITLYAKGFVPNSLNHAEAGTAPGTTRSTESAGAGPQSTGSADESRQPDAGHAKWFSYTGNPDHTGMLWKWAPDSYATIDGFAPGTRTEDEALWRHIAEELATNAQRPVPIAAYVESVPSGLFLVGFDRARNPATGLTRTTLTLNTHAYVPAPERNGPGMRIQITPGGPMPAVFEPDTGVDLPGPGPTYLGTVHVLDDVKDWTIDPIRY